MRAGGSRKKKSTRKQRATATEKLSAVQEDTGKKLTGKNGLHQRATVPKYARCSLLAVYPVKGSKEQPEGAAGERARGGMRAHRGGGGGVGGWVVGAWRKRS